MERSTQRTLLAAVTTTGFLHALSMSGVNVALERIASDLKLSAVSISWVTLSVILATGALLMPMARVADFRGRVLVYHIGLACFGLFCLAAAFAPNAATLIITRVLQGVAGALLFSTTVAMVTLAYPPEARGRALGLQVAGVYLGITLGPVVGGIITENLGWRALFIVVGALSLVNLMVPFRRLRGLEWRDPKTAPFDIWGSLVWVCALSALIIGFSYLPGITGYVLIVVGAAGLVGFVRAETRAADPILNVDLLRRNRVFASANAALFINYSATTAMSFLMGLYLLYNRGLGAQKAGLVMVTGPFVQAVVSPFAGRMADRLEARFIASTGMGFCAVGLFAFIFLRESTPYWYVIAVLCVLGLGFGLFASPIIHTVMGSIDRRYVGVGAATSSTMRVAGQSFSMGIAALVLAVVVGRHEIGPSDHVHLLRSVQMTFLIFAVLCVIGVFVALVGPGRRKGAETAQAASVLEERSPEAHRDAKTYEG
ncbi:MAG: MFS transporter [Actinobacteria bacterium]|jgi:MFS family permease|nr:MFS transporter [Actinomycetota bacterium]